VKQKTLSRFRGHATAQFVVRVLRQASRDRLMINASSLSFHWFISIVPGAIALVGIANLVGLSQRRLTSLTHGVSVLLPASTADIFDQALKSGHSGSSAVFAVVLTGLVAFWASLESTATLQIAMDMAYETNADRGFLRRRSRGLLLVAITVVLGGAASALLVIGSPLGTLLQPAGSSSWFPAVWNVFRWIVGVACVITLISLYDYLAPDRADRSWKLLSIGGSVSTVLWLGVAACYSFYLDRFGHATQTYGAFAGVIALLLWLFFTGTAILLGAEFNRELERGRAGKQPSEH
jgi:membrane protein